MHALVDDVRVHACCAKQDHIWADISESVDDELDALEIPECAKGEVRRRCRNEQVDKLIDDDMDKALAQMKDSN